MPAPQTTVLRLALGLAFPEEMLLNNTLFGLILINCLSTNLQMAQQKLGMVSQRASRSCSCMVMLLLVLAIVFLLILAFKLLGF